MGLGSHLVEELALQDSNDTLGRWLAHHLAQLMTEAQQAKTAVARREASRRAAELILKIWDRRAVLPGNSNPLAYYKEPLQILSALRPGAYAPHFRGGNRREVLAATLYKRMTEAIRLLCREALPAKKRELQGRAVQFLSTNELLALKKLERWIAGDSGTVAKKTRPTKCKVAGGATEITQLLVELVDDTIEQLRQFRTQLTQPTTSDGSGAANSRESPAASTRTRHRAQGSAPRAQPSC